MKKPFREVQDTKAGKIPGEIIERALDTVYVTKRQGKWSVVLMGASGRTRSFDRKDLAVSYAKKLGAVRNSSVYVVHEGKPRSKSTASRRKKVKRGGAAK